jgi:hypothetical protein
MENRSVQSPRVFRIVDGFSRSVISGWFDGSMLANPPSAGTGRSSPGHQQEILDNDGHEPNMLGMHGLIVAA